MHAYRISISNSSTTISCDGGRFIVDIYLHKTMRCVSPYMYEPTRQNFEQNEEGNSNSGNRLAGDVLDWCQCTQCVKMVLEKEL